MPGFPLPLRNALAELTLVAFDDDTAGAALAWLAAPAERPSTAAGAQLAAVHLVEPDGDRLLDVHAGHAAAVAAHAARARRAVHAFDRTRPSAGIERACRVGAALWNERLFFEVHEVLEAVWRSETGAVREALQGVIQIAVAFHHLAHGNLRGARSLLVEGRRRLSGVPPNTLPVLDVGGLLDDTARWEEALAMHDVPPDAPPRLGTHVA
ncbi:MAG TPA: DUF309 domain-containing protein [Candidatus Binatia bacterium]|nr:DUF309 domain-containing protein [Candidatus Binatia bacterium]